MKTIKTLPHRSLVFFFQCQSGVAFFLPWHPLLKQALLSTEMQYLILKAHAQLHALLVDCAPRAEKVLSSLAFSSPCQELSP